jgi:hypothetical protein
MMKIRGRDSADACPKRADLSKNNKEKKKHTKAKLAYSDFSSLTKSCSSSNFEIKQLSVSKPLSASKPGKDNTLAENNNAIINMRIETVRVKIQLQNSK